MEDDRLKTIRYFKGKLETFNDYWKSREVSIFYKTKSLTFKKFKIFNEK